MGPEVAPEERRFAAGRLFTAGRLSMAAVLWAAMGVGIAYATVCRAAEAYVAAALIGLVTSGRSRPMGDVVLTGLGTRSPAGLEITNECTVMMLIVPMLFIAGFLVLFRRFQIHSVLAGVLCGVVVVAITNQLRVLLIAWATQRYGFGWGYELSHKFAGSVLAIVGFSFGALVMFRLAPGFRFGGRR
jgi:exosortase/archaeosortase family protein